MIPVHGSKQDLAPDLSGLVLHELESIERGLKVLARAMPLEEGVIVDALAIDIDHRAVLVLVETEGEELHRRAADAVLAYRRSRALLARLLASDSLDETADPRLLLVARRFSDREEARCRLLPGNGTTLVEIAVVEGAAGRQILLLARGGDRPLSAVGPLGASGSVTAAVVSSNGSGSAANTSLAAKRSHGLRLIEAEAEIAPSVNGVVAKEMGVAAPNGHGPASGSSAVTANGHADAGSVDYFEEMKLRILRMSPDVLEEQDGDVLCFRIGSRRLAALSRAEANVARIGVEDGVDGVLVHDHATLTTTLDSLFERFFNLVATRSSSASAHSSRLQETSASKRPVREPPVAVDRTRVAARADS